MDNLSVSLISALGLALGAVFLNPPEAQSTPCEIGGVTAPGFSLTSTPRCYGALNGNSGENPINGISGIPVSGKNPGQFITGGAWGAQNWNLIASSDTNSGLQIQGTKQGTWSYPAFRIGNLYAIAIKAANQWSLYGFTANAFSASGAWDVALAGLKTNSGNIPDISHLSIFERCSTPTAVPEPITILGSVVALGAGILIKKQISPS